MQIHGTNRIHGPQGTNAPHFTPRTNAAQQAPSTGSVDRVDISPAAEAAMAAEGSPIRQGLVNSIRRQIADGTYDTPDKMEMALDRLLDEMV
jgi:negative regulator of flagellin synthesis FlgM